ncbi:MAG: glycosyltransferase family 1 protein [Mucilaginibacter sp.]|uniref:glycosyltransferase family 4 protein n=1 Tax=Mucilaginibacter sp. TaxID=1882438 RepID=UPI003266E6E3
MASKCIKLFVDAHSFDAGFQGTQTFIRELYTQLLKYPELDIYWGVEDGDKVKQLFPSVKPENILLYKKRRPAILRLVFDIPELIKKHKFDYAHFQYIAPMQQPNCKYIVTTHDVLFNDFPDSFSFAYRVSRNLLFGRSIKNAAIKTTVSNYSKERIAHHYGIPKEEIKVIPNGVSKLEISKEFARKNIKAKFGIENFILYVSRIEPRKNHVLLLSKYLKLELFKQNIPLVFIGQQSIRVKDLQDIIQKLTPYQKALFHWFPNVKQDDLNNFYAASRLFVYPSKAEGFGIPPLEAAVCEVPVLCSSATAMAEFEFFEPHTFNPDNEKEFESKLASIIANPPSQKGLKNTAEQILAKYQWQQSAYLFHNLLTIGLRDKPSKIQSISNNINTSQATPGLHFKY